MTHPDAVVVGSGPNGLAAAVTLAQAGLRVLVLEGAPNPGGGCRTEEATLPGFLHDRCAAVHPLVVGSPFFRQPAFASLRALARHSEFPLAHPLDDGRAAVLHRSVSDTAAGLGSDGATYRRLVEPFAQASQDVIEPLVGPLRSAPDHPVTVARFGAIGLLPATVLARRFGHAESRGLLAGVAAHSMLPLTNPLTSAFALLLMVAGHAVGWPLLEGGSAAVTRALVAELEAHGGSVVTGSWVRSLAELPPARVVLLDITPRQLLDLGGDDVPARYRRALARYRYGPGVCKVDWALSGPVPWRNERCRRAATVHVGGPFDEVSASEAAAAAGRRARRPFCIVVQPAVVDSTRAPAGQHTLWAYCHVPTGSTVDVSTDIEAQIERFAPGFRDLVLAKAVRTATDEEAANPNYVGGDIGAGMATLRQTIFRPTVRWNPYRTAWPNLYLCSAATPPGAGVHGMCGLYAARTALHDHFGGPRPFRAPPD